MLYSIVCYNKVDQSYWTTVTCSDDAYIGKYYTRALTIGTGQYKSVFPLSTRITSHLVTYWIINITSS